MPLAATLAGCAPAAPERPTWAEDVAPIILGSCGHCHGATADVTGMRRRFDVCDPAGFADTGFTFSAALVGAARQAGMLAAAVEGGDDEAMPPPPAAPLSGFEQQVLSRWAAINGRTRTAPCAAPAGNRRPTVTLVRAPRVEGAQVTVTVDVADADHDQVVGSLFAGPDCDPADTDAAAKAACLLRPRTGIPSSGRHQLTLDGVDPGAELRVRVSDGWGPAVAQRL